MSRAAGTLSVREAWSLLADAYERTTHGRPPVVLSSPYPLELGSSGICAAITWMEVRGVVLAATGQVMRRMMRDIARSPKGRLRSSASYWWRDPMEHEGRSVRATFCALMAAMADDWLAEQAASTQEDS